MLRLAELLLLTALLMTACSADPEPDALPEGDPQKSEAPEAEAPEIEPPETDPEDVNRGQRRDLRGEQGLEGR